MRVMNPNHMFPALALVLLIVGTAIPGLAQSLPAPSGKVLLSISGNIDYVNNGDRAEFDRDMLEAINARSLRTRSINDDDDVADWQVISLADILREVGAEGGRVELRATDGYTVEASRSLLEDSDTLIALSKNGKAMRLRQRGPLRIIFDYEALSQDEKKDLQSLGVWSLDRIRVF